MNTGDEIVRAEMAANPHREVAIVALFDSSDRILMVRTHRLPHLWQPLGGGVEDADVSPEAAAIREVLEETGLQIEVLELVMVVPYDLGEGSIYCYKSSLPARLVLESLAVNRSEIEEVSLFTLNEARSLPALAATHSFLEKLQPTMPK